MKNQYFGDINDYRKYGLLRTLTQETGLRCLVGWMLTPDDGRTDGRRIEYLEDPDTWRGYDPELFDALRRYVVEQGDRKVKLLRRSGLLPNTDFFPKIVPDSQPDRNYWFGRLLTASLDCDLVFLDPDNGIEVPSTRMGTRGSSKYVYWRELTDLFSLGSSLLVYQHFPRVKRDQFSEMKTIALAEKLGTDHVLALRTSHVVFLLAPQPGHWSTLCQALESVARTWHDQIHVSEFARHGEARFKPGTAGRSAGPGELPPHRTATHTAEDGTTTTTRKHGATKSLKASERASQIWQILVHKAAARETVTYGEVADLMGIGSAQGLGVFLNQIKRYCEANGHPPLHVLAVSKSTGRPGEGLPVDDFHGDRERVFSFNWFALVPPTPADFANAADW
jgi:hypothetical protein